MILSRPNLIVSSRRQIGAGEELEIELLNVPDGYKGNYQIQVGLTDQHGKTVYQSEKLYFNAELFKDITLSIPTEKYPDSLFMQPVVRVSYKNKAQTFEDSS